MKALIIIDMQMDMQQRIDRGQDCVNADAPARIEALAAAFRKAGQPVLHVRHREDDPASDFHIDAAGYQPMPCAQAAEGEPIYVKRTSSSFASTNLESYLRANNITDLIVVGAVAGFCINSTVRAGADLGFRMTVVRDAVLGFDLSGLSARTIFDVTMAHLEADFATVLDTSAIIQSEQVNS